VCSGFCDKSCGEKIYDFSQHALLAPWKEYAENNGFYTYPMFWNSDDGGGGAGHWNGNAQVRGTLPEGYNHVEVAFYATFHGEVWLQIDGVTMATAIAPCDMGDCRSETVTYQQTYSAGQVLRIVEIGYGGIGKDLKITLRKFCDKAVS
jgi:hypothetical protein